MENLKNFLEGNSDKISQEAKVELTEMYQHQSLEQICEALGVTYKDSMHERLAKAIPTTKNYKKDQSKNGSGVKLGTKKCMCNKKVEPEEYEILNNKRVCLSCVFRSLA